MLTVSSYLAFKLMRGQNILDTQDVTTIDELLKKMGTSTRTFRQFTAQLQQHTLNNVKLRSAQSQQKVNPHTQLREKQKL